GTPQTARDRWPSSYSSAAPGCHADGLARTRVWFDGGPVRCFATIGRQLTRRPRLPDREALEKAAAQPDSSCQPCGAAESCGGFRGWHRFLQHEVDELRQREAVAAPAVPPQHGPGGDQVVSQPLAHPVGGHDAVVQHGRAGHLNDVTAPAEQTQRILIIFSGVEWSATPEGRIEQPNTIYCLAADARVGGEPAEAAGKARAPDSVRFWDPGRDHAPGFGSWVWHEWTEDHEGALARSGGSRHLTHPRRPRLAVVVGEQDQRACRKHQRMVAGMGDADPVTAVIFQPAIAQQIRKRGEGGIVVALVDDEHAHPAVRAFEDSRNWGANRALAVSRADGHRNLLALKCHD